MPNDRAPRGAKPRGGKPAGGAGGAGKPARAGGASARGPRAASGPRTGRPAAGESRFGTGTRSGGGKPAPKSDLTGKPRAGGPGRSKPAGAGKYEKAERGGREGFGARAGAERGGREGFGAGAERGGREGYGARAGAERPKPAARARFEEAPRREREEDEFVGGGDIVFGRHAALATLEGPQAVNKVWVLNGLKNQELIAKVRQLAKEKGAIVQMVERPKLDSLTLDANHQGIVVSVAAATYVELEDVIEKARESQFPALLMLDGIEDPHNLGALIRSAEGAGFAGVIIPNRRAVGLTPVAVKSSAGAALRVPVARVGNLAQAAEALHKAGFWLLGADAEGEKLPYEVDMVQPIVVVVGSEGKGLGRLLAEKCDFVVRLPLGGELESLNASVAGGILMYEAVRQRWARERA
jgi:23S rRNA (guanosine2251-2'-O)-methyltransferase